MLSTLYSEVLLFLPPTCIEPSLKAKQSSTTATLIMTSDINMIYTNKSEPLKTDDGCTLCLCRVTFQSRGFLRGDLLEG